MLRGSNRRHVLAGLGLGVLSLAAGRVAAQEARDLAWEDLIPAGVPYSRIIGEGRRDETLDTWLPVFDENATRVVAELDGQRVRLPGFVIPLQLSGDGVKTFILAPYAGACIHVPPPPANQIVFIEAPKPFEIGNMFEAVAVTGTLRTQAMTNDLASFGYQLAAEQIERIVAR